MTLRVASYNLWNGANDTYFRLIDFIKAQKYEVLCLQEINGWQESDFAKLNDFKDRTGYTAYEYGNSNTEYKLATLSTLPITKQTAHVEGFWHCVVETHIQFAGKEVAILNLHLDPWKEEPRLHEVERLIDLIDAKLPTIITGDFNSISRQDNYPPEFLAEQKKRKSIKYGEEALDFRVTDFLATAGFVDMAAKFGRFIATVPTPYNTDEAHEVPARIDYMFVSQDLLPYVQDIEVVKNEETDKMSDHYPLVLTLSDEVDSGQPDDDEAAKEIRAALVLPEDNTQGQDNEHDEQTIVIEKPKDSPTEGEIKLH